MSEELLKKWKRYKEVTKKYKKELKNNPNLLFTYESWIADLLEWGKIVKDEARRETRKKVIWFFNRYRDMDMMDRTNESCSVKFEGKDEPISWTVAWLEIINNTKLAEQIINELYRIHYLEEKELQP